jgi:hypothetical protein
MPEILQQKDPDQYEKVGTQPTGFGAQTGFFSPALGKLFGATRRQQGGAGGKSSATRRNRSILHVLSGGGTLLTRGSFEDLEKQQQRCSR